MTASITRTTISFTSFDENGAEITRTLPARWVQCHVCYGEGSVSGHPDFHVTCDECGGTGEEAILIREICNPKIRAEYDAMNQAVEDQDWAEFDLAQAI